MEMHCSLASLAQACDRMRDTSLDGFAEFTFPSCSSWTSWKTQERLIERFSRRSNVIFARRLNKRNSAVSLLDACQNFSERNGMSLKICL